MIRIDTNVVASQMYNCWAYVQIGTIAVYVGHRPHAVWSLRLFPPYWIEHKSSPIQINVWCEYKPFPRRNPSPLSEPLLGSKPTCESEPK